MIGVNIGVNIQSAFFVHSTVSFYFISTCPVLLKNEASEMYNAPWRRKKTRHAPTIKSHVGLVSSRPLGGDKRQHILMERCRDCFASVPVRNPLFTFVHIRPAPCTRGVMYDQLLCLEVNYILYLVNVCGVCVCVCVCVLACVCVRTGMCMRACV